MSLVGNLRRNDDNDAAAEVTGDIEQCSDGGVDDFDAAPGKPGPLGNESNVLRGDLELFVGDSGLFVEDFGLSSEANSSSSSSRSTVILVVTATKLPEVSSSASRSASSSLHVSARGSASGSASSSLHVSAGGCLYLSILEYLTHSEINKITYSQNNKALYNFKLKKHNFAARSVRLIT
nr:hypothetical protein Iba_chr01aCG2130 [Ipomoea batatas]